MQYLHVLALILMQPLDENIEYRVRIGLNPELIVNICRKLRLVVPLDGSPLVAEVSIFKEGLQPAQPLDVADPGRADTCRQQLGKTGIAQYHPAPGRDSVGLVGKLFRTQHIKIVEHAGLQKFRVERRHAVDGMAPQRGQVRHAHGLLAVGPVFIDQREAFDATRIARELLAHIV